MTIHMTYLTGCPGIWEGSNIQTRQTEEGENDGKQSNELGNKIESYIQGPGLFFVMPCIDSFSPVDMRTVSFDVPPQEVRP